MTFETQQIELLTNPNKRFPFEVSMDKLTCDSNWIIKLARLTLHHSLDTLVVHHSPHLTTVQRYLALAHSPPSTIVTYSSGHKLTTTKKNLKNQKNQKIKSKT